jgi:hypothetical protein
MLLMLFPDQWTRSNELPVPFLATPLGNLALDCSIHGSSAVADHEATFRKSAGTRLLTFDTEAAQAALLICEADPTLPEGMCIRGAKVAIWRIFAKRLLDDYALSCRWEQDTPLGPGGVCSGQGIAAQEWSYAGTKVTIGTQNLWAMISTRNNGGAIPERWIRESWSERPDQISFEKYLADGLQLRPPYLEVGELLQVHFVAALADAAENSAATWYAVDLSPSEALSQAK